MQKVKDFFINNFIAIYVIYFITLFIDATTLIIDYPVLETVTKYIRYFAYLLFAIRLFFILPKYKEFIFGTKWKDKTIYEKIIFFVFVIMVIALVISALTTDNKRSLFIIFVLLSSFDTDYKKIFKTTMFLQVSLTAIVVLLSVWGYTQDFLVPRESFKRHSLGFQYTTYLVQMYMFSTILYIYQVGKKISYRDIFILQFLNALMYLLTRTRAEYYVAEVIIIATLIIKILSNFNKDIIFEKIKTFYAKFFSYTFVLYPIAFFDLVLCYRFGGIFEKINVELSNRLHQTYLCIYDYGIHLFGEKIEFVGFGVKEKLKYGSFSSNYVDNEYIQLMLSEGLIFAICFIIVIALLLLMLNKKKKYKEIMLCSIFLLFGLINPRIENMIYCPILFMIIPTLLECSKKDTNEKLEENE